MRDGRSYRCGGNRIDGMFGVEKRKKKTLAWEIWSKGAVQIVSPSNGLKGEGGKSGLAPERGGEWGLYVKMHNRSNACGGK